MSPSNFQAHRRSAHVVLRSHEGPASLLYSEPRIVVVGSHRFERGCLSGSSGLREGKAFRLDCEVHNVQLTNRDRGTVYAIKLVLDL